MNKDNKIIEIKHFADNVLDGFSLVLDKKTHTPKYLVEYEDGKMSKVIVEFHDSGRIKSFNSADIYSDSQKIKFHDNGVIKSIGNTVNGSANGLWYYFDEEGNVIRRDLYENGAVIKDN